MEVLQSVTNEDIGRELRLCQDFWETYLATPDKEHSLRQDFDKSVLDGLRIALLWVLGSNVTPSQYLQKQRFDHLEQDAAWDAWGKGNRAPMRKLLPKFTASFEAFEKRQEVKRAQKLATNARGRKHRAKFNHAVQEMIDA